MNNKDMPARAKCSYADKYQVKRKPKCGCATCNAKWKAVIAELESQNKQPVERDRSSHSFCCDCSASQEAKRYGFSLHFSQPRTRAGI